MGSHHPPRIALVCSRVRVEEKMLLAALRASDAAFERIDPRRLVLDLQGAGPGADSLDGYDAVLVRCLSHSRAFYLTRWFEDRGVTTISSHQTVSICGDKVLTSAALQAAGVPIPRTRVALSVESALDAIEELGPTGDYLTNAHTLRHFKEPFYSKLADKSTHSQWQQRGATTMEERAAQQVDRILRDHEPEPLPADVQGGIREIVEREQARIAR
jgi:hypothetical protein